MFPADTPRTPLPIWGVAEDKPEGTAAVLAFGLGHSSNNLKGGSARTEPTLAWQETVMCYPGPIFWSKFFTQTNKKQCLLYC